MKIYVAGRITGKEDFEQDFERAAYKLRKQGHVVMNPAILPPGFTQTEYMTVCIAMLDICEAIYLLKGWQTSVGANIEKDHADRTGKLIYFEGDKIPPPSNMVPCPRCGIEHYTTDYVFLRKDTSHEAEPSWYSCPYCGGEFHSLEV